MPEWKTYRRFPMLKKTATTTLLLFIFAAGALDAKIVKIPPPTQENCPYAELPCTQLQKTYICELITSMGEQSWFSLFKNRGHLEAIGAHINSVHPLKFLGTIFSNPSLKPQMAAIFDDSLKKNQLMNNGLIPNLDREAEKGNLHKYLRDFAEEIHVSPQALEGYFHSHQWEEMVRFLIQS